MKLDNVIPIDQNIILPNIIRDIRYLSVTIGKDDTYWEDATLYIKQEDGSIIDVREKEIKNGLPMIPCFDTEKMQWNAVIDLDTGNIINWNNRYGENSHVVGASIHYKVRDEAIYRFEKENHNLIFEFSDYHVPTGLNIETIDTSTYFDEYFLEMYQTGEWDLGFQDYIVLDIDANGNIKDWDKLKTHMINNIIRFLHDMWGIDVDIKQLIKHK